jgi:amidase
LNSIAAEYEIKIPVNDQEDYLWLLQTAELFAKELEESPDYIHPALAPSLSSRGNRTFWKPTTEDNPLGAWSHRCRISKKQVCSSLLQGRTICVKDNISVAGLPTTLGTFPGFVSKNADYPISQIDATVVSRVLDAGGILLGTATCENYSASPASSSSPDGPVQNPWLHGHTAGGSSSGCGALMGVNAMRLETNDINFGQTVDLAIGGDQGGSIRIPASYNGVYGLKATHGLIPYTGVAALSPMVDHIGLMAAKLEDIALLLTTLAGYDGLDPRMTPETPLRHKIKDYPEILSSFKHRPLALGEKIGSGMKIGLLIEAFEDLSVSSAVRDCVLNNAKEFFSLAGAEVNEISIPLHKQGPAIWTIATRDSMVEWGCKAHNSGVLSHGLPHLQPRWPMDQEMFDLQTKKSPEFIDLVFVEALLKKYGPDLEAKAHRKIYELRAAYDAAFEQVDVIVTPCMPTVAMEHPKNEFTVKEKILSSAGCANNTCPFNITGHPAMNVPCGFGVPVNGQKGKLPIGMQLVGKRWHEDSMLNAAAVFEEGKKLSGIK